MATGTKILVAMRSWVEEQLSALRAWAEASLSNKVSKETLDIKPTTTQVIINPWQPGTSEQVIKADTGDDYKTVFDSSGLTYEHSKAGEVIHTWTAATAADLAGKMNNSYSDLGPVDLLNWAKTQTIGGNFCINPSVGTTGVPVAGLWYNGTLDVTRESPIGPGRSIKLTPTNAGIRTSWENHLFNGEWVGWVEYPAATPPQEYALPLAAGWVRVNAAEYWIAQDHKVTVTFRVAKMGGAAIPAGAYHIATLPVGLRPSGYIPHIAISTMTAIPAVAWVTEDGNVFANAFDNIPSAGGDNPSAWSGFAGTISFYAA